MVEVLHEEKQAHSKKAENRSPVLLAVVSLLWLIFRTGTKPSRIMYPCQRAALANSSLLLSFVLPFSLTAVLTKTKRFLSRKGMAVVLLLIVASAVASSEQIWGSLLSTEVVDPNQEIQLVLESRNASMSPASDIFVMNGREAARIRGLVDLMGSQGLRFYKSSTEGRNQGPDGLIARDDVVLIKINEQWVARGGTNTDLLKELLQVIIRHPEVFVGEVVVADNGQGRGRMNWYNSNAEDVLQSTQDVVDMFAPYYNVSTFDWQTIRRIQVEEYGTDLTDGYILYNVTDPETGIYVSYPKFRTEFGTCISFKHGIWNGTGFEKRLKVINMPVLKSHLIYGVTASVKNYMGVQSEGYSVSGGLANGHVCVATGGMGTLMVETGLPTLNILDAIWVNANPFPSSMTGPSTSYSEATRANVLMGSTDPVALDYWAAKHVLVQAASFVGYNDTHTLDPDNSKRSGLVEAFGVWLNLTKNEIRAGGYNVTSDENAMNVYVTQAGAVPTISILSPSDPFYPTSNVSLAFIVNEPTDWMGYSLDGQTNVTIGGSTILSNLLEGLHFVVVYANDTVGNLGMSEVVPFTIDTVSPNITGISQMPPANEVLPLDEVKVNATVVDETSGVDQVILMYTFANASGAWDRSIGMTNVVGIIWSATIPAFPFATNVTCVFEAMDHAGNMVSSEELGYEHQYVVVSEPLLFLVLPFLGVITLLLVLRGWEKRGREILR